MLQIPVLDMTAKMVVGAAPPIAPRSVGDYVV